MHAILYVYNNIYISGAKDFNLQIGMSGFVHSSLFIHQNNKQPA